MAFGAAAGPAEAPIQSSAIISTPGASQSVYDDDDNLEFQTPDGSHVKGGADQLSKVVYSFPAALLAYVDATQDGSAADTGILTSANSAADQHGLPANFGPGRGNWTKGDNYRISVELVNQYGDPVAGGAVEVVSTEVDGVDPGDIRMILKNLSEADVSFLDIRVQYEHSLSY